MYKEFNKDFIMDKHETMVRDIMEISRLWLKSSTSTKLEVAARIGFGALSSGAILHNTNDWDAIFDYAVCDDDSRRTALQVLESEVEDIDPPKNTFDEVIEEVRREYENQKALHNKEGEEKSIDDWCRLMINAAADTYPPMFYPRTDYFLRKMTSVAAIAIAAIEHRSDRF